MKKLSLKSLGIEPAELLTREQMKGLAGGGSSDSCSVTIQCDNKHYASPSCSNATCQATTTGVYCGDTFYTNAEICKAAGF